MNRQLRRNLLNKLPKTSKEDPQSMTACRFREELCAKLMAAGPRVLLRIAVGGAQEEHLEFSGEEILKRARELAAPYAKTAGSRVVLLLLPHSPELFLLHLGLVIEGACPAILPWPTSRMDAEKYYRNLIHQLRELPAGSLVTAPFLAEGLGGLLPYPVYGQAMTAASYLDLRVPEGIHVEGEQATHAVGEDEAEALFLQFSGGTTGAQKAVVVTAKMLDEQLRSLREVLDFTAADGVASWLPLYHDMGLIACLWLPLWNQAPSMQFAASDWLLAPELLFRNLEQYKATFCWLPNFAFSYLAQRAPDMTGSYDLGHVRGFVSCSEPVRLKSIREFQAAFGQWKVAPGAVQASYAMAETVFAVTQTELGSVPRSTARGELNGMGELAFGLGDSAFVSSGRIVPGMQVQVVNGTGQPNGDGQPGEIHIQGSCLFRGYWGKHGFITSSFTADGWYATGDYGFLRDGELYVIGRIKDIVIVGGQNIFPEDVETVVNTVEGVYPGRVVVFGVPDEQYGTESLTVVAEMRGVFEDRGARALESEIRKLVLAAAGVAPRFVKVAPERWIVKSTAGKISRRETRERFLRERAVGT